MERNYVTVTVCIHGGKCVCMCMQSGYNHSGSRTSSSNDSSKRRSDVAGTSFAGPRLPQSMLNTSADQLGVPPAGAGRPAAAAMRKARSVEELDQPRSRQPARGRKSSFQSEVSSLWNVTPPGSVAELDADALDDDDAAETRSTKSAGGRARGKAPKAAKSRADERQQADASGGRKKTKKPQPPPPPPAKKKSTPKPAAVVERQPSDGNESEEYFLDDDDDDDDASSVDDLDVEVRPTGRSKKGGKPLPVAPEPAASKGDKKKKKGGKEKATKDKKWMAEEQARILKVT